MYGIAIMVVVLLTIGNFLWEARRMCVWFGGKPEWQKAAERSWFQAFAIGVFLYAMLYFR